MTNASFRYALFEESRDKLDKKDKKRKGKRLNNVTFVMGSQPCKTLKKQMGCWVDVTRK